MRGKSSLGVYVSQVSLQEISHHPFWLGESDFCIAIMESIRWHQCHLKKRLLLEWIVKTTYEGSEGDHLALKKYLCIAYFLTDSHSLRFSWQKTGPVIFLHTSFLLCPMQILGTERYGDLVVVSTKFYTYIYSSRLRNWKIGIPKISVRTGHHKNFLILVQSYFLAFTYSQLCLSL